MTATSAQSARPVRKPLSNRARRAVWIGVVAMVILGVALGTKVVPSDDPLAQGAVSFDPETFGVENFSSVKEGVTDNAVDAVTLAEAIAADPEAASEKYAVQSSGGPVYSVSFTGVVGEGRSGIYEVVVDGLPEGLLVRIQTGPAINGTELRDATGEIEFGQFKNQIDFQNAAAALNNQLKSEVLTGVDAAALPGSTVTVTGAFTLVNPAGWLVTPVELSIR